MNPCSVIDLEAIPKSNAAVIDSPLNAPDRGTSTEGIVLFVAIVTLVTFKGMVFTDRSAT